ncbi:hypothetical protein J3F82_004727 [Coemansia sp. RSA 637]|nr:hypothetical protein J3F82_004727 [Coemansia sp. RSA 637]
MQTLIVELAVGYDKQLTKYANDMPTPFPYTLTAPNLIVLDLTFSDSSDLIFPTICPRSLRKIYIELENQPFSWDMFRVGVEAEAIVFDNLVNLSISGMVQDPDADNAMANDLDMRFPKLERLVLTNSYLARNEADAMMAHGLKRFQHEGSIIAASQLCKQPFGNLDELYLCWEKKKYFDEADSFVPLANEIFNKTKGIEYVQCEIRMPNFSRNMDGVDWPYLTHLSLGFTMTFKALFKMLPKVPNLVQLDMIIGGYDRNELTKTIRLLTNIKKHYPTPSLSKIKKLLLADERAALRRKSYFQPQFRKALENLKWYWPQLKDIGYFD